MSEPSRVILAIDVGGTKTAAALVDGEGRILTRYSASTPRDTSNDIGEVLRKVKSRLDLSGSDIHAAVVGVPEFVSPKGKVISTEVLSWKEQPSSTVAELFNMPQELTLTVSDVRSGAMGEWRWGAASDLNSFLYVSLGTGLSSALFTGSSLWDGQSGRAIAMGEQRVAGTADNTLESFASGRGMEIRYREQTGREVTSRELDDLAEAGDAVAIEFLNSSAAALAAGLRNAVCMMDPGVVILGGGLGASRGFFGSALEREYYQLSDMSAVKARLLRARLGSDSALLGCAAYGWRMVHR